MLKGVNKQVIEVVDTGSRYFERAILIVNPRNMTNQVKIYDEAARIFGGGPSVVKKKSKKVFVYIAAMTGFTGLGAVITAVLINAFK